MKIRYLILLLAVSSVQLFGFGSQTFFGTRSQAVNAARDIVGIQRLIPHLYDHSSSKPVRKKEKQQGDRPVQRWSEGRKKSDEKPVMQDADYQSYTVLSATAEYNHSFHPDRIREFLFGCEKCLVFSGSRSANRGKNDILADYFGLPADFKSTVQFKPVIMNAVIDFNAFWGLDDLLPGLYVRFDIPIIHTRWDLNLCETVDNPGTDFHPAGYMGPVRLERNRLAENVRQAFGGFKFGDVCDPLRYGKICGAQSLTHLGEMYVTFGWNYVDRAWWHAGVSLRTAIKTCGQSKAEYLFEPLAGNGGHWGLGAGFTGHVDCWENGDHKIAFYADLNIDHLFSSKQKRSYDLKNNGNGSRYILVEQLRFPTYDLVVGGVPAQLQYQGCLTPAINQTTLDTRISIAAQMDCVIKLAYQYKAWELDLGYNAYFRTAESCDCRATLPTNSFALKGDAQLYGFDLISDKRTPVNATQSQATLHAGQGATNFVGVSPFANSNADNAAGAQDAAAANLVQLTIEDAAALSAVITQIDGSNLPVLLTDNDINQCSALLPKAFSNKFFVNVTHMWQDVSCIVPYIAAGASAEFAATRAQKNSASSAWAVWVKGGFSY
jgi:hypothetical protein